MQDGKAAHHPMRRLFKNRRGVLAGAGALLGAGLARLGTAERAQAAHGSDVTYNHNNVLHVGHGHGTVNTVQRETVLGFSFELHPDRFALSVGHFGLGPAYDGGPRIGLHGYAQSATTNTSGVHGESTQGVSNGVWGDNRSTTDNAKGVYGLASGASGATVGVWGETKSTTTNACGVFGLAAATTGTTVGVWGRTSSNSVGTKGVFGESKLTTGAAIGTAGQISTTTNFSSGVNGSSLGLTGETYGVVGSILSTTANASGVKGVGFGDGPTNAVFGENAASHTLATGVKGQTNGGGAGVRGQIGGPAANTGSGVVGVAAGCDFGNSSSVGVGGSGRTTGSLAGGKTGVLGITGNTGIGVEGWASNGGTGVRGSANFGGGPDFSGSGIGVEGRSGSGIGVQGRSTSGMGLVGLSTSNYGIYGLSTSNYGIYGFSTNTNGIVGGSGGNGAALVGITTNGIGVYGGVRAGGSGYAGQFDGPVVVRSLTVLNGPKSSAVKKRDGTHVRMYCQESPEPWFEDFGTAELRRGEATVALDPEFDEVVDGTNYRVFITEIGKCGPLYVSQKGPHRFGVKSHAGPTANGSFDYRVVARRADPVGTRLERVTLPKPVEIKEPPELRSEPTRPGRAD